MSSTEAEGAFVHDAASGDSLWQWTSKAAEAEALQRFWRAVMNTPAMHKDWPAFLAGLEAITQRMCKLKGRGRPSNSLPEIDSAEFSIALDLAQGKTNYTKAVARLSKTIHKGERTAQDLLALMKPYAEKGAGILAQIADDPTIEPAYKRLRPAQLLQHHAWGIPPQRIRSN